MPGPYDLDSFGRNIGTLVIGAIRPNSPLDLISSAYSSEIMGGLHTASASSDRDSIMTVRREWGMLCYVINDKKTYQLEPGYVDTDITNNLNWREFNGSGGGSSEWINSVLTITVIEPLSPTNGDRYLVGLGPYNTIIGSNWLSHGGSFGGFLSEWNSSIGSWIYTDPTDNMSVRVDDEDNAIYRYEGNWTGGSWQKEKESQVRYINATTLNGVNYTASSNPTFDHYDTESLYIVKFGSVNTGASTSLNINGLGNVIVKKMDGNILSDVIANDISINYQYMITYDGTYFEMLNFTGGTGLLIKYDILPSETIVVPANTEYFVYGDLTIGGTLDNYGYVVVANGSMSVTGTFSNYGSYSNVYFPEIHDMGVNYYVPHWMNTYTLTASSSIYDNGNLVNISSVTFSINSDIIIPNGASNSYVLTSNSNGVAEWKPNTGHKYAATMSLIGNQTYSISHNLNSEDIVINVWDEDSGEQIMIDIFKTSANTLGITASSDPILNIRLVVMS